MRHAAKGVKEKYASTNVELGLEFGAFKHAEILPDEEHSGYAE